jgi:hypothetical protein
MWPEVSRQSVNKIEKKALFRATKEAETKKAGDSPAFVKTWFRLEPVAAQ